MITIPYDDLKKIKCLGEGGCGKVYLAKSKKYGTVALKKTIFQEDEKVMKDFQNEVDLLYKIMHPNVIRFYGTSKSKKSQYIVMEYAANGTLFEFLGNLRKNNLEDSFFWDERYKIAQDITKGLLCTHESKVLHRDMKSANILLDLNMTAKISDFGLSKIKKGTQMISAAHGVTNDVFGSLLWKAPETFSMDNLYTEKADIYALGVIFWEIATCQVPYEGIDIHTIYIAVENGKRPQIPPSCPEAFKNLIELCWSQDPKQRPSAVEVSRLIDEINNDCLKAENKDFEMEKWKITKPPDFEENIFKAAAKGKLTTIIYLLANGNNINESFPNDSYDGWYGLKNSTPLHFSSRYGHLSVVEYLVNQKADINSKDENDNTPLHFAARNGHLSVVEYLVNQKADINSKDENDNTPLHFAARNGHLSVVEFLVNQKADINSKDENDNTPLHFAARNGHLSVVEFLVNQKADINSKDENDNTPLHFAARNGHLSVVEFLVNQKADINSKDENDNTPLHFAAQNGHLSVVEYLVNQKADIHAIGSYVEFFKFIIPLFILLLKMVILVLLNI